MYRWELDGPAQQEFADLPPAARASLAVFMDAAVIVDPVHDLVLVVKIQWLGG